MQEWERPYGSEGEFLCRYAAACATSLVVACLCGIAIQGQPPSTWIPVGFFFSACVTLLWRVVLVGLYTSELGIKVRTVWRTRVVPWSAIDRFWTGRASNYDAWTVWVSVRGSDQSIETPIWRHGSPTQHKNREMLESAEFAQLLEYLNAEVARRNAREP